MRPMRAFLVALLAAVVTLGGATSTGLTTPAVAAATSIWQVTPTVNPDGTASSPTNSTFAGVSASGANEAWAVGTFLNEDSFDQPLVEHWDGTAWTRVAFPAPTVQPPRVCTTKKKRTTCTNPPAVTQQVTLSGVFDLSPTDAWAVGTSGGLTLIEHWNGTAWSIVPSPNPATGIPGDNDVLDGIAGTGPKDLWAAGWDTNEATGSISMLFEHWNGSAWTAVASPTPIGSTQVASGVTVISPTDAWAVGSDLDGGSSTLAAHWNGTAWSIVPTPAITSTGLNHLTGVSAAGPDDVWASGFAADVNGDNLNVPGLLHSNGKSWSAADVPTTGAEGSLLNSVQVLSRTDAWAVGQSQGDDGSIMTLTEQFNGSVWTVVPSPDPGTIGGTLVDNTLESVGRDGDGNLFAVGLRGAGKQGLCCERTLAISTNEG